MAIAFVLSADPVARIWILAVAAATDIADGVWARRIGGSRAGVVLDPLADKVFVGAAFVVVALSGDLGMVEIFGVLLRDVLAVLGFVAIRILKRPTTLPARAGGKAVTVSQVLTLLAWVVESDLLRPLAWATAAISVYAVADYGRVAWSK